VTSVQSISSDAMNGLMQYRWPGNVRELKNTLERAVLITDGDTLISKFLPGHIAKHSKDEPARAVETSEAYLEDTLKNVEKQLILDALERADGVQRRAAKLLGVTERVLWYKIKKLGIAVNEPEPDPTKPVDSAS
jgi:transcriptional regulator with PAS, ATPase and Fis domain